MIQLVSILKKKLGLNGWLTQISSLHSVGYKFSNAGSVTGDAGLVV
jgi:hypothetical protein